MDSQIKVFFAGQIQEGCDPQQVRLNLAKLHQVSLEKIEALFTGKRKVVKIVNDYEAARKIEQVYSNAGAVCTLEPPPPGEDEPAPIPASAVEPVAESQKIEPEQQGREQERADADSLSPNLFVSDALETPAAKFEVLTYRSLAGSDNMAVASMIHKAQHSGVRLKQVRITLADSEVILEAGALHFQKGDITIESKVGGVGGLFKKVVSKKLTDESAFKPTYRGSGEIYLEPGFGHFILLSLKDEEIVADKGMFLACQTSVKVGVATQKGLATGLLGGEGFFQTKLSGKGICVLQSPVPVKEIIKVSLNDETLQVDGNFALLRKGNVEFTVNGATKSLIGSMTSGEGILQTFHGTGEVWLAPTQSVYQQLALNGLGGMAGSVKRSRTWTR
ncbi:MAG: AIM24 family protein [Candidatus Electrothrix sp. Rat3]|nr:AIM24 family protein [Candidatus Electrothrix rattekaaiensis]